MNRRRFAGPGTAVLACFLLWLGWRELDQLRGTPLWDLRNVVFAAAVFLVLTAAERIAAALAASAGDRNGAPPVRADRTGGNAAPAGDDPRPVA